MFFGWGKDAADDLKDYRDGYPRQRVNKKSVANFKFFANQTKMQPENILIEDLLKWKGHYRQLEWSHTYIQWLFPIREQGLNWQAEPLQPHEIEAMRADPIILDRVLRGFEMMLDFYGFELQRSTAKISRKEKYQDQFYNLNTSGHNYLRITRILKNLGEMGLEAYKVAWLDALYEEIFVHKTLTACESSYGRYWVGAIYDDALRMAFLKRIKSGDNIDAPFPSPPDQFATSGETVVADSERPAKSAGDESGESEDRDTITESPKAETSPAPMNATIPASDEASKNENASEA